MEMLKTIVAGTFVFISSKLIEKFLIEPVLSLKSTIRLIENYLILYANVVDVNNYHLDYINEIALKHRELAASLVSGASAVPSYSLLRLLFGLPAISCIINASENLIGYSNNIAKPDYSLRIQQINNIRNHLKLKHPK